MKKTKNEWISLFRTEAERVLLFALKQTNRNQKAKVINDAIKRLSSNFIKKIKQTAEIEGWKNQTLLNEILLITYASYIVMLEYRNKVWPYEYMAFARRIGELWEPFCKLAFQYPIKKLKLIEPPDFDEVQAEIKKKTLDYISELNISDSERRILIYYYRFPWGLVDSGGIKLGLDLHFEQDGIHYNCDFKSGFSSNEKGNTNRLLLVGSIYQSLGQNEKTLLFVRQEEEQNNHYLQTLKDSPYWSCYCANACYSKIAEFTGFNLRTWIDYNIDWKNDISDEFKKHLVDNSLIGYLTW
ncbi:hypothetical protein KQI69_02640 [Eubacterium sp. MSJ-13]|uniref:hypothetical protein n=1 Tax=Eubacterium sp. MSJ-13 TaxID=2841513 RepID=UPI001C101C8C|nr:hypothetical protein [Eubacterium sp. MSJ-13]MBU5478093.1 hypothetical protein [Eubacterium sp. MSJ-13]